VKAKSEISASGINGGDGERQYGGVRAGRGRKRERKRRREKREKREKRKRNESLYPICIWHLA